MRDSADTSSFSLSSLLCHEDQTCLNQLEVESNTCVDSNPCFVSVDEDEYVENLVRREAHCFGSKGFVPFTDCSASDICWLKNARLDSIEWIFNACYSSKALNFSRFLFLFSISLFFVLESVPECLCILYFDFADRKSFWVPIANSLFICHLL